MGDVAFLIVCALMILVPAADEWRKARRRRLQGDPRLGRLAGGGALRLTGLHETQRLLIDKGKAPRRIIGRLHRPPFSSPTAEERDELLSSMEEDLDRIGRAARRASIPMPSQPTKGKS